MSDDEYEEAENLNEEQIEDYMEDIEEEDQHLAKLKIPDDLEGQGEDRFNMAEDSEDNDDHKGLFGNEEVKENKSGLQGNVEGEDVENEIFA